MVEVDQLPVGIVLLEHDGMITAVNSAACSLFARTREALIGTSGLSLLQLGADAWYALLGGLGERGRADANVHVVRPGGRRGRWRRRGRARRGRRAGRTRRRRPAGAGSGPRCR